MNARTHLIAFAIAVGLATVVAPDPGQAQQTLDIPGVVIDVATRQGIADVVLRVVGTDVTAATNEAGRFVLRGLPVGEWTLQVDHLAYGSHEHVISVAADQLVELQIRLAAEAIELEPLVVQAQSARDRAERAQGSSLNVVDRAQIEKALGTSKHMGDLIRQTIPGIRLRQTNNLAGTDVCLEFRGAASISLVKQRGCSHPMVLLDGVPISDPNYLYGTVGLSNIERIQVIPPAEAGARYGTGSLYGVILIDTRPPGNSRAADEREFTSLGLKRGRVSFDWDTDPAGHPLARTATAAFLGNALGLVAGIAVGERCIAMDDKEQIRTTCGDIGNAGAVVGALVLPALGATLGSHFAGGTDLSVGQIVPALVGAGMMIFPGYAFSMSTVGGGSQTANVIGNTLLVVGAPLVVTLADRLFRKLR